MPPRVQPCALLFTDQYKRRAANFLKPRPALRSTYLKTLQLLHASPAHPYPRLRALRGKLEGLHSVSITVAYRITLELLIQDPQIITVNGGEHDAVY